jgi:hypothetical protein
MLQSMQMMVVFIIFPSSKVPVCFVIGDVEGHDEQCTHYGSHQTSGLSHHECNCPTDSADNHAIVCKYIKASHLTIELCRQQDLKTLKLLSFHNVTNAFDNVCFGANKYGIHRATPSEVLHSLQKGWYQYACEGFFSKIGGPAIIDFLELLVARVSADCVYQSDCNMPRLKFANGIQSFRHTRPLVFCYHLLSVSTARLVGMQIVHPQLPRTPLHIAIIAMFTL